MQDLIPTSPLPGSTQVLLNALIANNVPSHAFIFYAEHPTPLNHVIEIFLKQWLKEKAPENTLHWDAHPDIISIQEESSLKVEHIQRIQEITKYGPQILNRQFIIIHNADSLTVGAANAFLKTLETPPNGVCFILLTHTIHKILPTIASRCQKLFCQKFSLSEESKTTIPFEQVMNSPLFKNLEITEQLVSQKEQLNDTLKSWLKESMNKYPNDPEYSQAILQTLERLHFNGNAKLQTEFLMTSLRLMQNQKKRSKQ